jgi:uncharacterized membrane protein
MAVVRETEDLARERFRHQHEHPPVRDLNREEDRRARRADQVGADAVRGVGSWLFIGAQALIAILWIVLNAAGVHRWDGYPFLLLNLIFSAEALVAVTLVLMVLNRRYVRERLRAQQEFEQEVKLEEELRALMTHLERQDEMLIEVLRRLDRSERELRRIQRVLEEAGVSG